MMRMGFMKISQREFSGEADLQAMIALVSPLTTSTGKPWLDCSRYAAAAPKLL